MPTTPLWSLVVYFVVVVALVAVIFLLSYVLGERHRDPATGEPFESGIKATGSARVRFDVKYYLVAMFFVVFDLEAAFIMAWAVAARENGWAGYLEILVFIAILVAGLIYLWKLGALDWSSTPRRRLDRGGQDARELTGHAAERRG